MRQLITIAALVAGVTLASTAQAQTIDDALQLENQGLLVDALDTFEELLRTPGNPRMDLVTILQHLAVLRFAAEDDAGARDALGRLLVIAPDEPLPDAAPPSLLEMHEMESRRFTGSPLRADLSLEEPDRDEIPIRVRVVNDVLDLVAGVELVSGDEVLDTDGGDGPTYRVFAPRRRIDEVAVQLLDEHGGVLWEGTIDHTVEAPEDPADIAPETPTEYPRWHRIVAAVLLGAGAASVITGGVLVGIDGASTGVERVVDGIMEEQVWRTAAGGWVLIGLGGAAILGGLIWLLMGRTPASADGEPEDFALELLTFL